MFQATASEVQHLLVSGRKKEALQCAQEGQLWGPALVLASQLGDQVFLSVTAIFDFIQIIWLTRKIVRYLPTSHFLLYFFGAGVIQYYVDTVKLMALRQLVAGSPLRTLCLLIAGQPAEVFSTNATGHGGLCGDFSTPQQPIQVRYWCMKIVILPYQGLNACAMLILFAKHIYGIINLIEVFL